MVFKKEKRGREEKKKREGKEKIKKGGKEKRKGKRKKGERRETKFSFFYCVCYLVIARGIVGDDDPPRTNLHKLNHNNITRVIKLP